MLQIQIFVGLKLEIKTVTEAVGWCWGTCEWWGTCKVHHPSKGGAATQIQAIITVLECKPSISPDVPIFMQHLPSLKHLQLILKKKNQIVCIPPPQKIQKKTCSQAYDGLWAISLGPCTISNLWYKPSHPPSSN